MNELIPIRKSQGGRNVVSARELHQFLEVGTRIDTWFNRRAEEYLFVQGIDYQGPILSNGLTDYDITLDMAKELAMVERNQKGREARQYFIWSENKLKELAMAGPAQLPTDFAAALRLLADSVEAKARLQAQLDEQAPKVAFTEAVALAGNPIPISAVAKYLKLPGIGRNKLFALLRTDKILRANNEPYQQHIDNGHFAVELQVYEAGEKGGRTAGTTRCTSKGLIYLALRYKHLA